MVEARVFPVSDLGWGWHSAKSYLWFHFFVFPCEFLKVLFGSWENEKRKVLHKMSVINSCYGTAKNSLTNE